MKYFIKLDNENELYEADSYHEAIDFARDNGGGMVMTPDELAGTQMARKNPEVYYGDKHLGFVERGKEYQKLRDLYGQREWDRRKAEEEAKERGDDDDDDDLVQNPGRRRRRRSIRRNPRKNIACGEWAEELTQIEDPYAAESAAQDRCLSDFQSKRRKLKSTAFEKRGRKAKPKKPAKFVAISNRGTEYRVATKSEALAKAGKFGNVYELTASGKRGALVKKGAPKKSGPKRNPAPTRGRRSPKRNPKMDPRDIMREQKKLLLDEEAVRNSAALLTTAEMDDLILKIGNASETLVQLAGNRGSLKEYQRRKKTIDIALRKAGIVVPNVDEVLFEERVQLLGEDGEASGLINYPVEIRRMSDRLARIRRQVTALQPRVNKALAKDAMKRARAAARVMKNLGDGTKIDDEDEFKSRFRNAIDAIKDANVVLSVMKRRKKSPLPGVINEKVVEPDPGLTPSGKDRIVIKPLGTFTQFIFNPNGASGDAIMNALEPFVPEQNRKQGYRFDEKRHWVVPSWCFPEVYKKLKKISTLDKYSLGRAKSHYRDELNATKNQVLKGRKEKIKLPAGMAPKMGETPEGQRVPYQEEGIRFLMQRRAAILADDMGLGKTFQSIVAAETIVPRTQQILVLCPSAVVGNWADAEIPMFAGAPAMIVTKDTKSIPKDARKVRFVVASYDTATLLSGETEEDKEASDDDEIDDIYEETDIDVDVDVDGDEEDDFEVDGDEEEIDVADYDVEGIRTGRKRKIRKPHRVVEMLANREWGLVIMDEAHRAKKIDTGASQFAQRLHTHRMWLLTGTPITNRPHDLYGLLLLLRHPFAGSLKEFKERYGKRKDLTPKKRGRKPPPETELRKIIKMYQQGMSISAIADKVQPSVATVGKYIKLWECGLLFRPKPPAQINFDELSAAVSPIMLRRTKASVLSKVLPQKLYETVFIPENQLPEEVWGDGLGLEVGGYQGFRKALAYAKVEFTWDRMQSLLSQGEKVVVFSKYVDAMNAIAKLCRKHGIPYVQVRGGGEWGGNDMKAYAKLLFQGEWRRDKFPKGAKGDKMWKEANEKVKEAFKVQDLKKIPKRIPVFLGQMRAAAEGITLTKARHLIFNDLVDTPTAHAQAEDRIYRIGAKKGQDAVIHYMLADTKLDEDNWNRIKEKLDEQAEIYSGLRDPDRGLQRMSADQFKRLYDKRPRGWYKVKNPRKNCKCGSLCCEKVGVFHTQPVRL